MPENTATQQLEVACIKLSQARKINPRIQGHIEYQVGKDRDQLYLRISANDSSGTFSKEWIALTGIEKVLTDPAIAGQPFKASIFNEVFHKKSQNNAGFLAAALRAEGLIEATGDLGMMNLYTGKLDAWKADMLALAETIPPPEPKADNTSDSASNNPASEGTGQADAGAKQTGKKAKKSSS